MPVLRLSHITKRFGSLTANDDISLSLAAGEIVALLGENGAGKTTLMNILFGHYVADEGEIEINGQTMTPGSTDAAISAGVGMVHQHFTLADNLSVLDNIVLGTEPLWAWKRDNAAAIARIAALSEDYGLVVDPHAMVGDLSVGERQRVEILKALYRSARILILDEPTAVLSPQEATQLFATLKRLTQDGLAVIFISHKLHEILSVSDRVVVLRRGKVVGEVATPDANRADLAEMMVGREVNRPQIEPATPGAPVLRLANASVRGAGGAVRLDQVDLEVRAHEIVGIAGVAGNGQRALAALLSGLARLDDGQMELRGKPLGRAAPAEIVAAGVGRIPEDRHAMGVIGEMAVWENLISEDLRSPDILKWGAVVDAGKGRARATDRIAEFDIRCQGADAQTRLLSGGNMQKLILARALAGEPAFILANQPVRGLDEGAIAFVHARLLAARQRGAGILLISEDLDELLAFSDRIAVLYQGRLSQTFATKSVTTAQIGLMMAGQTPPETPATDKGVGIGADH